MQSHSSRGGGGGGTLNSPVILDDTIEESAFSTPGAAPSSLAPAGVRGASPELPPYHHQLLPSLASFPPPLPSDPMPSFPPLPSEPLPDLSTLLDYDAMPLGELDNAALMASLDDRLLSGGVSRAQRMREQSSTTSADAHAARDDSLALRAVAESATLSQLRSEASSSSAFTAVGRDTTSRHDVSPSRSRGRRGRPPYKSSDKRSRDSSASRDGSARSRSARSPPDKRRVRHRHDADDEPAAAEIAHYRIETPPARILRTPPVATPSSPPPLSPIPRPSRSRDRSPPDSPPSHRRRRVARIESSSASSSGSRDSSRETGDTTPSPPRRVSPLRLRLRRQTPPRSPSPAADSDDNDDTSFCSESSRPTSPEWSP